MQNMPHWFKWHIALRHKSTMQQKCPYISYTNIAIRMSLYVKYHECNGNNKIVTRMTLYVKYQHEMPMSLYVKYKHCKKNAVFRDILWRKKLIWCLRIITNYTTFSLSILPCKITGVEILSRLMLIKESQIYKFLCLKKIHE